MSPCTEYLPLLSDRAAGAEGPLDAARLDAHLTHCAACRTEVELLAATLSLARLPPVSEAERGALAGLAESIRHEQRRSGLRRRAPVRYAAALLAVAAAAAFLVAPAFTRRAPRLGAGDAAVAEKAPWEAPDVDELWSDTDLAVDDGAAAAMAGADELALDALLVDE